MPVGVPQYGEQFVPNPNAKWVHCPKCKSYRFQRNKSREKCSDCHYERVKK